MTPGGDLWCTLDQVAHPHLALVPLLEAGLIGEGPTTPMPPRLYALYELDSWHLYRWNPPGSTQYCEAEFDLTPT